MTKATWIGLSPRERTLILEALTAMRLSRFGSKKEIDALATKLTHAEAYPKITVGIVGGQLEWTHGNPFPIRVCDYDATSDVDLPDVDERGRRCRMWLEPANVS